MFKSMMIFIENKNSVEKPLQRLPTHKSDRVMQH